MIIGRSTLLVVLFFFIMVITGVFVLYYSSSKGPPVHELEERAIYQATFVFAGDVMIHDSQIKAAYNQEDQTYSFHSCFERIGPIIQEMNLAVVNLETTLAGEDQQYTGYPAFNAPESLASALKEAGFQLVSTANNHSLDRGEYGVIKTIEHLEEAGLRPFGTHRSYQERERPLVKDIGGIRAAFFSYTYSTNGIPIPEEKEYLVNMLKMERILEDIDLVRDEVDLIILYLHWGVEYQRIPTEEQRILAQRLLEEGASIIIGNHPHVVQPLEMVETGDGEGLVAYSLGNLTGDQILPYTDTGILVFVVVEKEEGKKPEILEVTYVPTWIYRFYHGGRRQFQVLPILSHEEYLEQLRQDPSISYETVHHLKGIMRELGEHIGDIPQGLPGKGT